MKFNSKDYEFDFIISNLNKKQPNFVKKLELGNDPVVNEIFKDRINISSK